MRIGRGEMAWNRSLADYPQPAKPVRFFGARDYGEGSLSAGVLWIVEFLESLTLVDAAAYATIAAVIVGFCAWVWPRSKKDAPQTQSSNQLSDSANAAEPPKPTTPNPLLATHFVDRPDLIAQIMQAVATPQTPAAGPRTAIISSLQGMGGVGKTELAREVARRLNCPGGTAEVNLRGRDSAQPMGEEEALRDLCPQLDPTTDPTLPLPHLRAHWRQVTSGRRSLVILDNLSNRALLDALRPTDGITLVTSRTSNLVKGVPGIDVGVMQPAEAAALARQNCPTLSEDDAQALAAAVGYLPLAVEIAAQRLNDSGESVAALAERLADPNRTARVLKGDGSQENVLLRVLEWSLEGLSDEQKQRWQALALPPGDFGLWAVQALWLDEDPVDDLASLTRRNLVSRLPGDEPRWRLHDVLRRFGLAALAALAVDETQQQTLWRRLGPAAVMRLREINARFRSGGDAMVPALAELDQELPLLRAVQAWAAERIEADAVAAEVAVTSHHQILMLRLKNDENLEWMLGQLRAAEHRGEKAEIARAAGNLGLVYRHRGDLDRATEMHEESLAIAEELGDRAEQARQYGNLGLVHLERGDLDRAAEMHEKSLAIAEELGDRAGTARQSGNLGLVYQSRGDLDQAAEALKRCIAIFEDLADRHGIALNVYFLGNVLKDKGDWAGTAEHFRRSLALAEELGMPLAEHVREALAEAEAHLAGSGS